jgi:hypothetical protein
VTQVFASLLYTFMIVSYVASAGTEGLSSVFKWRPNVLFKGIKAILNDEVTGLASAIYRSALIHPRGSGDESSPEFRRTLPSYVDPRYFAVALMAALGMDRRSISELQGKDLHDIDTWIGTNILALRHDDQMRQLVGTLIFINKANEEGISAGLSEWFTRASDRISGAYKRRVQMSNFAIALALAVMFNLNPLPPVISFIEQTVAPPAEQPAMPSAVVLPSQPAAPVGQGSSSPAAALPASAPTDQAPAAPTASVADAGAPGSTVSASIRSSWMVAEKLIGWLVMALSSLLGAPFWFGILSRIAGVRVAGGGAPPPGAQAPPPAVPPAGPPPGPAPGPAPGNGPPPTSSSAASTAAAPAPVAPSASPPGPPPPPGPSAA